MVLFRNQGELGVPVPAVEDGLRRNHDEKFSVLICLCPELTSVNLPSNNLEPDVEKKPVSLISATPRMDAEKTQKHR